jgi:hypothetical protein
MSEGRKAKIVSFPEHREDESSYYFEVGKAFGYKGPTVTQIIVSKDLPGPHGPMERVRVWGDGFLIAEAPLHAVEVIIYA